MRQLAKRGKQFFCCLVTVLCLTSAVLFLPERAEAAPSAEQNKTLEMNVS